MYVTMRRRYFMDALSSAAMAMSRPGLPASPKECELQATASAQASQTDIGLLGMGQIAGAPGQSSRIDTNRELTDTRP
jgi:hypothetical protein